MADGRTMNGVDRRGLIAAMAGAMLPVPGWARAGDGHAALRLDLPGGHDYCDLLFH